MIKLPAVVTITPLCCFSMTATTAANEYADPTCYMGGSGGYKRFNAPHRLELNWLTVANNTITATPSATAYTVKANGVVAAGSTDIALLRLPALATNGDAFWVSLRTSSATVPTSYDTALNADYVNKLYVHRMPVPTGSGSTGSLTKMVARLTVGESFVDYTNGFRVTFQGLTVGSDSATVLVSLACPAGQYGAAAATGCTACAAGR